MKNIEIYNTLNIDKDSSSIVATFTQEDDAVMEFKLFKDGQEIVLKDQTISLGAERKDGAVIEQDDGFLIKENNVLNITLKKNIIQVVGVVKIQLYLKDKSGEMASNTFNIRVNKKLLGAENVEATNDIKVLNTLVLELKNNTNKLIDDTKAKADKLLSGLQETGDNLSDTVKAKTNKIIEDTKAEVDNIKKDYEGLKKVVIDENIGIKLQNDVTELQNGLKSNQSLAYKGSSIAAENTLEGRTEGMRIGGRTLINLFTISRNYIAEQNKQCVCENDNKDIYTNKQYSLINLISKNVAVNIYKKNPSGYLRTINIPGNSIKTLTLNENEYVYSNNGIYDGSEWNGTQEDLKLLKQSLLVLEGDWTNKPIPQYFEGLKSLGESEQEGDKYKISILSRTRNLLDNNVNSENVEDAVFYDYKTGRKNTLESAFTVNIPLKANTTFSMYGVNRNVSYWKYGVFKGSVSKEFADNSFTTQISPVYDCILKVTVMKDSKDIAYVVLGDSELNPYQQYKQDKKDILIKEPLREGDYLYEDNGQVKVYREAREYTFTGDEGFTIVAQPPDESLIRFQYFDEHRNIKASGSGYCNNFMFVKGINSLTNGECIGTHTTGNNLINIIVKRSKLSTQDVEGLKAWLRENPTTVIYQLDKPVTEVVENCVDIDLDTFQDKTYFSIENSLPGTLDFKVPSNIASIVQNTAREVNNIWDVINNLLVPGILDVNKKVALATIKNNLK